MTPYHVLMTHFPIAIWMTATLAIRWRAFSDGLLAHAIERALVPLLSISLMFGLVAFSIDLLVWPRETISASAIGRNHVLAASWTEACWASVLYTCWRHGAAVWTGVMRWVMTALDTLGSLLPGITDTLGGHLVGIYTAWSDGLRLRGWEVYTTFYVPDVIVRGAREAVPEADDRLTVEARCVATTLALRRLHGYRNDRAGSRQLNSGRAPVSPWSSAGWRVRSLRPATIRSG